MTKPGGDKPGADKSSVDKSSVDKRAADKTAADRTGFRNARAGRGSARGSASARKSGESAEPLEGDSAPERWLANIRISGFTFMILLLLVLGVIVLAPSLKLLIEQQQQISALQKSVTDQKDKVSNLKDRVARWDDPAYIVAQARNRLLFVYPGEYSYLVVNKGQTPTTTDGAPISAQIQDTKVDWLQSLTSSLLTAGLSKAPASTLDSPLQSPQSSPSQSRSPGDQ